MADTPFRDAVVLLTSERPDLEAVKREMAERSRQIARDAHAEVWRLIIEGSAHDMIARLLAPDDEELDPPPLSEERRARARQTLQAALKRKSPAKRRSKPAEHYAPRHSSERERGAAIVRFIATLCGWAHS